MPESEPKSREFKLEPDSELRFEIESKNEKVSLEVSILLVTLSFIFIVQVEESIFSYFLLWLLVYCTKFFL